LLELYNQEGKKNPFGNVYIDFGVQVNGSPQINSIQAKLLMDEFNKRGVNIGGGIVPNFTQLRLVADQEVGLAYKLADDVKEVAQVSAYPFYDVGRSGLFRAFLGGDGSWDAIDNSLAVSDDYGRVVRYDAQGVAHKKLQKDLVTTLTNEFRAKF